jgi:AAA family ATP:ADP antiporter
MFGGMVQFFYPDIKKEEIKKFSLLAGAFFFTIGTYWILRLLKDVLIYELAFPASLGWGVGYGRELIPALKLCSLGTVLLSVFIYSKLIDMFEKHKLFTVIGSFYIGLFGLITSVLLLTNYYGDAFIGKWPLAIVGVVGYLATESFGSLIIALFWSFTISSCTTDQAKRGFPFIIAAAQVGSIGGSTLVYFNFPDWFLFSLCMTTIGGIIFVINYMVKTIPKDQMVSDKVEKKSKPDFLAGVKLLATRPYLMGVLVVSTFYEIAKTVVDYQMKSQAAIIPSVNFKEFIGMYGMCVNALALVMALLGTSYIMKRFGLRFCLLLYPVMFGVSLIGLYAFYITGPQPVALLWATFGVMIVVTATSYAVNNPTKEMMYIPTSKDAKFKVKGLTDMFGSRSAKMSGARIGGALNVPGDAVKSIARLMGIGTIISLGFIGVWLLAAIYVGQKNAQLVRDDEIVE